MVALIQCVLSPSHDNSTPERGFPINKILLQAHGASIHEDVIIALRINKDELHRVRGALNVMITRDLLDAVHAAYSRYEVDRVARKEANLRLENEKKNRRRKE